MAIAKSKCDICDRDVNPEELIACDECYHKLEKEHKDFEELFGRISVLLDNNISKRMRIVFPFPMKR